MVFSRAATCAKPSAVELPFQWDKVRVLESPFKKLDCPLLIRLQLCGITENVNKAGSVRHAISSEVPRDSKQIKSIYTARATGNCIYTPY